MKLYNIYSKIFDEKINVKSKKRSAFEIEGGSIITYIKHTIIGTRFIEMKSTIIQITIIG